MTEAPLYGLMAEFDNPTDLMRAARATYAAGYRDMDAYTPYPIEELADAIGFEKTRVPLICLMGGILGGLSRIPFAVLDQHHRLSAEHRRAAVPLLAGLHHRYLRDDDPVRRTFGGDRNAGAEWPARALSSGVQSSALQRGASATASSSASRPPIRSSIPTRRVFLRATDALDIAEVAD